MTHNNFNIREDLMNNIVNFIFDDKLTDTKGENYIPTTIKVYHQQRI